MIFTSSLMLETSEPIRLWSALRSDRDFSIQPSNVNPAGTKTDIRVTVTAMCMAFLSGCGGFSPIQQIFSFWKRPSENHKTADCRLEEASHVLRFSYQ